MYIGAWTEYRLSLEKQQRRHQTRSGLDDQQQQTSRRPSSTKHPNHAFIPSISCGRTGGAPGIYHPSLVGKGGEGVFNLPDRESFRKTLESALSSNLPADDAENITQALEPLLERLPTIRAPSRSRRAPTSIQRRRSCRDRHRRSCRRLNTSGRGEGMKSARLASSSDGTGSARSSFSSASAPTKAAAQWMPVFSTTNGRACSASCNRKSRRRIPTVPQLPYIDHHAGDALRVIAVNGTTSTPARERRDSGNEAATKMERAGNKNPQVQQNDDGRHSCAKGNINGGGNSDAASVSPLQKQPHASEQFLDGGYDGCKAAALVRLAKNRDPAGIKADFQQFWRWKTGSDQRPKRRAPMVTVPTGDWDSGDCVAHPKCREHPRSAVVAGDTESIVERARATGGGGALSKMEILARMKDVYMSKNTTENNSSSSGNSGGGNLSSNNSEHERHVPGDVDGGGEIGHQRNKSESISPLEEEQVVAVPDLELTESRIRLIDKYFGGGDRRRQSFRNMDASSGGTPRSGAGSNVATRPPAFPGIHADSSIPNHDKAGSTQEVGVGNQLLESSLSTANAADNVEVKTLSGQPAYNQHGSHETELQQGYLLHRCKVDSISTGNDETLAEGRFHKDAEAVCKLEVQRDVPLDPPKGTSSHDEIVAQCDEEVPGSGGACATLEDLVCWTQQLDFEAAVAGY